MGGIAREVGCEGAMGGWRPSTAAWVVGLLLWCAVVGVEGAAEVQVPNEQEISSMDTETLSLAVSAFAKRNQEMQEQLQSLVGQKVQLRELVEQAKVKSEKLAGDKRWEEARKQEEENDLRQANTEFAEKQNAMGALEIHVAELKSEVEQMSAKLQELYAERDKDVQRLNNPSLLDLVSDDSQHWSTGVRAVYNRTLEDVIPAVQHVQDSVQDYRRNASRASIRLASAAMYMFLFCSFFIVRRIIRTAGERLTVARVIFLCDAYCATLWSFVSFVYLLIREDPLVLTKQRNMVIFFLIQVAALVMYVVYVLLRVAILANSLTIQAFLELLGVIAVGQHYYVYIWLPSLASDGFTGSVTAYAIYSWFFYAIGMLRIGSFSSGRPGDKSPWWTPIGLWERAYEHFQQFSATNRAMSDAQTGVTEAKTENNGIGMDDVEAVVVVPAASSSTKSQD